MKKFDAYRSGREVMLFERGNFTVDELPMPFSLPILTDGDNRKYFTYGGKYFYMDNKDWSTI